jgi:hypothetical protein
MVQYQKQNGLTIKAICGASELSVLMDVLLVCFVHCVNQWCRRATYTFNNSQPCVLGAAVAVPQLP